MNVIIYLGTVTEEGQTPVGTTGLNADTYIFLGGVPDDYLLPPQADFGLFQGCIQGFAV